MRKQINTKDYKQISARVHPKFHKELKVVATKRGISVNLLFIRALHNYLRVKADDFIDDDE